MMVPVEDIVALSTDVDTEENFQRMAANHHTRYPLIDEDMTDFRGIVYLPIITQYRDETADGNIDFIELAAPPMTVSPDVDVSDAIDRFQAENQELAYVIEDGEIIGMVTATDLLESVTGDLEDPLDSGQTAPPGEAWEGAYSQMVVLRPSVDDRFRRAC